MKFKLFFLSLVILLSIAGSASAESMPKVEYNGKELDLSGMTINIEGSNYIPLRAFVEDILDGEIIYRGGNYPTRVYTETLNKDIPIHRFRRYIIEGTNYLSLRDLAAALEIEVNYIASENKVVLTDQPKDPRDYEVNGVKIPNEYQFRKYYGDRLTHAEDPKLRNYVTEIALSEMYGLSENRGAMYYLNRGKIPCELYFDSKSQDCNFITFSTSGSSEHKYMADFLTYIGIPTTESDIKNIIDDIVKRALETDTRDHTFELYASEDLRVVYDSSLQDINYKEKGKQKAMYDLEHFGDELEFVTWSKYME